MLFPSRPAYGDHTWPLDQSAKPKAVPQAPNVDPTAVQICRHTDIAGMQGQLLLCASDYQTIRQSVKALMPTTCS